MEAGESGEFKEGAGTIVGGELRVFGLVQPMDVLGEDVAVGWRKVGKRSLGLLESNQAAAEEGAEVGSEVGGGMKEREIFGWRFGGRRGRWPMAVHVELEFFHGEDAFGDVGGVLPETGTQESVEGAGEVATAEMKDAPFAEDPGPGGGWIVEARVIGMGFQAVEEGGRWGTLGGYGWCVG